MRTLLAGAPARGTIARGLGRCYGDAAQNAGGAVIATRGLRERLEVDAENGLATVDAGVSIGELAACSVPRGWFPPIVPGTRFVTIGGAVAADIHGKNHHVDGSFARHLVSFDIVTADGERRTIAPDTEPELFAATAGGMGLTGVVVSAVVRLRRVETTRITADTERVDDLDELLARLEADDDRYRYSVAWVDCLARGAQLGRGLLARGNDASADELPADLRTRPLELDQRSQLAAPRWVPAGLIRTETMRVFNELWFRRAPRRETASLETVESFFWPLDRIRGWNRLYGRDGLLQYQFVVPFGEEEVLRLALERFAIEGCASLGVLKRFGPGRGLLSFPIEGWTLAVDAPAGAPALAPLLDELDEAVAGAGGRVYLAKDSRMRPELLPVMYPELDRWREIQAKVDPDGALRSDLARRLDLLAR